MRRRSRSSRVPRVARDPNAAPPARPSPRAAARRPRAQAPRRSPTRRGPRPRCRQRRRGAQKRRRGEGLGVELEERQPAERRLQHPDDRERRRRGFVAETSPRVREERPRPRAPARSPAPTGSSSAERHTSGDRRQGQQQQRGMISQPVHAAHAREPPAVQRAEQPLREDGEVEIRVEEVPVLGHADDEQRGEPRRTPPRSRRGGRERSGRGRVGRSGSGMGWERGRAPYQCTASGERARTPRVRRVAKRAALRRLVRTAAFDPRSAVGGPMRLAPCTHVQ